MVWKSLPIFTKRSAPSTERNKLIVGVTIGSSAYSFLRGQLQWLSKQGWEPVLVSTPDRMAIAASERENVPLEGIQMERGISPIKDLVSLYRWFKLIRVQKPVALSVGTPKASFLGMIAAAILQVPRRLYVVRGLRLEGTTGPISWILWMMEWLTMALATDVFYVSESLAKECKKRSLHFSGKSWLIGQGSSNGVDAHAIVEVTESVDREQLRQRLGIKQEDFIVGFIGRINKDKGIEQIFDALKSSRIDPSIKILALGDLEDESLAHELDLLKEKIILTGWKDDAWSYFPAMDLLCLPTKREGFPNVVLEAAVAKIPTITTYATGAIDSVIHDQTGLLVPYGDSGALVDSFNLLVEDSEKLNSLGTAAQIRAINSFMPENIWIGINEILRRKPMRVESRPFI